MYCSFQIKLLDAILVTQSFLVTSGKNSISFFSFLTKHPAGCLVKKEKKEILFLPEVTRKLCVTKIASSNFIWNEQYKVTMKNDYAKGLSIQYLGENGIKSVPKRYSNKLNKDIYPPSHLSIWKLSLIHI